MRNSTIVMSLLAAGLMSFGVTANAADNMGEAVVTFPGSLVYFDAPYSVDLTWEGEEFELTQPLVSEYEEEYANVLASFDEEEAIEVPAYYIYTPAFSNPDEGIEFDAEYALSVAFWELDDLNLSSVRSIAITLPEGLVVNKEGLTNPEQTILFTKSPYADSPVFYDMTWDPEDGSTLKTDNAVITIGFEGYEIAYLTGTIGLNNYTEFTFGVVEFGKEVTINENNELVIDLSGRTPGEYELMIPDGFVTVDVDGETYINGSLYLEYMLEKGDSDSVAGIGNDSVSKPVYNLRGVKVGESGSFRAGKSAPGIYIIDGKKIMIK